MSRKKIVLVIVEGPSDETALGISLSRFFNKDLVYVHIMHGDITTRLGIEPHNIVSRLGDEVKAYAKSNHYKATDFKQIVHIVDMDAAYLSEDKIIADSKDTTIVYEDDGIHTNDKNKVISRNEHKVRNLSRLRTLSSIWNISYKVYYMSCDLDHVLYDKRNSTDVEKETDAYAFAEKYKNDIDGFVRYICDSSFSVIDSYIESWNFIEQDMRSIERYTNFGICLEEELKNNRDSKTYSS